MIRAYFYQLENYNTITYYIIYYFITLSISDNANQRINIILYEILQLSYIVHSTYIHVVHHSSVTLCMLEHGS
jgi:hypothetical protein